jgi:hypothetical protein
VPSTVRVMNHECSLVADNVLNISLHGTNCDVGSHSLLTALLVVVFPLITQHDTQSTPNLTTEFPCNKYKGMASLCATNYEALAE